MSSALLLISLTAESSSTPTLAARRAMRSSSTMVCCSASPLTVDEATAQSAVRNLQDVPINGRPVRIELSADDQRSAPPRRGFGGNEVNRPPGQELLPGQKATDAITKTLAAISPGQMQDVMANMKVRGVGRADHRI